MPDPNTESENLDAEEKGEEELETKSPEGDEGEDEKSEKDDSSKKEPPTPEPSSDDDEPPLRKSAKDHIIDRKQKKIEKLEKDKSGDQDYELEPEAGKTIQEEVRKATEPVLNQVRAQADETELQAVFEKYGDAAKKMEKQIRKYMGAYKNVAIEFIFLGLAAKEMKLQEKRKQADEEAEGKAIGGHSRRGKSVGKIPDVRKMSDKQVEDLAFKAKTGQFKP